MADSQTHQQYLCSLCSTMPLQYILVMLTGLKKKDQVLKLLCIYCMAKLSINIYSYVVISTLWLVLECVATG